jgi:hypothetical protein
MKKAPSKDSLKDLWPTQSVELLKSLHILTRDGQLNQDSRRKLKQVQHLVQLITPELEGLKSIADLGAGKSYLGFMLYDLWLQSRADTRLLAIEQRPDLIEKCRELATRSGYERIQFVPQSILEAIDIAEDIDAVTALHACDTATDEAIAFAIRKNAKFVALVPCCQAEVARLLAKVPPGKNDELQILWRHNLHRREFGSHLTNVIRCLFLESKGYKVRVTELIGWEHSMKNEVLLAKKVDVPNEKSQQQLKDLLEKLPLPMRLFELVSPT